MVHLREMVLYDKLEKDEKEVWKKRDVKVSRKEGNGKKRIEKEKIRIKREGKQHGRK
jgi:hypothetical protein